MAMGETELYEIAYDLYGKVFEGGIRRDIK